MRLHLLVALAAAGAIAPAAAGAAGYPVPGLDTTKTGATAPGDPYRYVAFPGRGSTTLVKVSRDAGVVIRHRRLKGESVVGAVAMDASTTGLSADGATLVLIDPRKGPQRVTHLAVIDTLSLLPTARVALRGDFSLDGISPDGRRLYLVKYASPGGNPLDYAVRVYDLPSRRLLPKPLVDARHPDEKMTGFPMTRALSADGRWAYTLYGGGDEEFVHALDVAKGQAFCIDLHGLLPDELAAMKLAARTGHVDLVNQAGDTVRRIDATTFKVTTPPQRAIALPNPPNDDAAPSDGFPWGLAAAVAVVGAGALVLLRRRYAAGTDAATSSSESSSRPTVP
jgi:hypothetical protein